MNTVQEDYELFAPPPPGVSIARAMLWNWWVVLLAVIVCVLVATGIALLRTPTYTAIAKLEVGRINTASPGALSGYADATQALATAYSRTVSARAVARSVAAKTGISTADVQSHVSATPIPESPVFKVEASSPNEGQAMVLANDSSHSLVRYAAEVNQHNPDSDRLYRQYRAAIVHHGLAKKQLQAAEATAKARPVPKAEAEVAEAQSAVQATALKVSALGAAYTASVQSQAATQLIQIISPATKATSDRRSLLMILAFVGMVAGLLIGGALAVLRESRLHADLGH